MHPSRLARILAAALLAALLLPQAALAAEPSTPLPAIKLSCALVVPNPLSAIAPNRAIVCNVAGTRRRDGGEVPAVADRSTAAPASWSWSRTPTRGFATPTSASGRVTRTATS